LAGQADVLEAVRAVPLDIHDVDLDSTQREAVAKALATSDVFLLRGFPGTGKSRVVAEIVVQATRRGERLLLLSRNAPPIDRILELVGSKEGICALRCVGSEERLEQLPRSSRALTLAEKVRHLSTDTVQQARGEVLALERRGRRALQDLNIWDQLGKLAALLEPLDQQLNSLAAQAARVPEEVSRDAAAALANNAGVSDDSFVTIFATCQQKHQETQAQIEGALAACQSQGEHLRAECAALGAQLEAMLQARQQRRWWTATWWRALFRGIRSTQMPALQERKRQLGVALEALDQEIQTLHKRRDQAAEDFRTERTVQIEAEVARRRAQITTREAAIRQQRHLLERQWHTGCASLDPEGPRPEAVSLPAYLAARTAWNARAEQTEREAELAGRVVAVLQDSVLLSSRLPDYANLVAATMTSLAADSHFGDRAAPPVIFDVLIVQEAEQLTESELLHMARRARRCVLVGEFFGESRGAQSAGVAASSRAVPTSASAFPGLVSSRGRSLQPSSFQQLWQQLHCEPRSLPYTWFWEGDRLGCRLRPLAADQRRWVECERVADFPEIELRILALPHTEPSLAEVVFPQSFSIDQAKTYIFRELEELPIQASGHSFRWFEYQDRLVLHLAAEAAEDVKPILLEAGVRELVQAARSETNGKPADSGWRTACLEFERAAGWNRPRAEEWIRHHLGVRDLGRTVCLDISYRMHPHLAAFISTLLFDGDYQSAQRSTARCACANTGVPALKGACPCVEFVPVPPLREKNLPSKGGAGLEVDLTDVRHRDRLPADLRHDLPGVGIVNYIEAQTVIRALEALATNPALDAALGATQDGVRPAIGVVALYAAQADLIRRLLQQKPAVSTGRFSIEVNTPSAFREREYPIVLVSLTRSHTHRAVAFGDDPHLVALALTRARSKLVVFGDPGGLVRRSQWEGPLEHLDAAAAARERSLVSHLVHYLQGRGPHTGVLRVPEGAGA
jgi:hypothetical protein